MGLSVATIYQIGAAAPMFPHSITGKRMRFFSINNLKISYRLTIGFGILVVCTLLMGGLDIFSIINLSSLVSEIYSHPFQVTDRAQQIKMGILEMDRDICDILCVEDKVTDEDKKVHAIQISHIQDIDTQIAEHVKIVRQFYLGPAENIDKLSTALDNFRSSRKQAMETHENGHLPEAVVIVRPKGESPATKALLVVQTIIQFAHNKATSLQNQFNSNRDWAIFSLLASMFALMALGLFVARTVALGITRPLDLLQQRMSSLAAGDLSVEVPLRKGKTEIAAIARAAQAFKEAAVRLEGQRWVKSSVSELNTAMQSAINLPNFAQALISNLTSMCGGGVGIFYLADAAGKHLKLLASYGLKKRRGLHTEFQLGEGLVGQAALEHKTILLTEVPDDYARITTGIGEAVPQQILVAPVISKDRGLAVVEIGTFRPFSTDEEALIEEMLPVIALNLEILERNQRTEELLEQTQQQAEELCESQEALRIQSEQLRANNEDLQSKSHVLQEQAEELRASEEELRAQSEQLQATNEDLKRKGLSLQEHTEKLRTSEEELRIQREELQAANEELTEKGRGLEAQAVLLERARTESDRRLLERDTANRYKSEFLSNMSHELRTPLNSMLILARSLRDNDDGNLIADQVESAGIIYDSGTALLRLINDILDLSKVEAGKMEVVATDIPFEELIDTLKKRFRLIAQTKGLKLNMLAEPGLPPLLHSDPGKLDQILNNLMGNAVKFTEHGNVNVVVRPATLPGAPGAALISAVAIAVSDTGIGIPQDKMESIFNAFEQVDGTTSRRYGGTGLGLTISRRLAELLSGNIAITSTEGQGSIFTLTLPLIVDSTQVVTTRSSQAVRFRAALAPPVTNDSPVLVPPKSNPAGIEDDRQTLTTGDETVLVIEDDAAFARIVRDLARQRGFKCLLASDGLMGLQLAKFYLPTGIVLDIGLPGVDGWNVMQQLKQLPETRHIPVHFISATDFSQRGLEMGAVGYLTKPVTKEQIDGAFERIRHFGLAGPRRLLLVEDDVASRKAVASILSEVEVEIVDEPTGQGALQRLRSGEKFDCMILDLGLPDIGGLPLLEQCNKEQLAVPPVVVYSGRDISDQDSLALQEYTDSVVIKGVCSPERLVDEVTLFLHSVHKRLPAAQQQALRAPSEAALESGLTGRTVLVVDDDMRNAFALSKVLRAKGIRILIAQDGEKALKQVDERPEIDAVLMDIMMPGMDGYTAIQKIRSKENCQALPIIALTAKAMRGDREKCIEAGASDYLSKPVDIDALMAMLHTQLQDLTPPTPLSGGLQSPPI